MSTETLAARLAAHMNMADIQAATLAARKASGMNLVVAIDERGRWQVADARDTGAAALQMDLLVWDMSRAECLAFLRDVASLDGAA